MSHDPNQFTTINYETYDAQAAETLIQLALNEDLNNLDDITSVLTISPVERGNVAINARQEGRVCGLAVAAQVLNAVDSSLKLNVKIKDGSSVSTGQTVAEISGLTKQLLIAERTVLNFMTHLSGIATLTAQFVEQVKQTNAVILDTRKTHPGFRHLEKYAVRCGGGTNHRIGLYDAILIKDNHLAARKIAHPDESYKELFQSARSQYPGVIIEVEVDTLVQMEQMIDGKPDIILLDNMSNENLKQAVKLRDKLCPDILLEASGGVNLETVHDIGSTGVDRISVGSLTHSAPAFDFGFDWINK